jgi:hypothetical protein
MRVAETYRKSGVGGVPTRILAGKLVVRLVHFTQLRKGVGLSPTSIQTRGLVASGRDVGSNTPLATVSSSSLNSLSLASLLRSSRVERMRTPCAIVAGGAGSKLGGLTFQPAFVSIPDTSNASHLLSNVTGKTSIKTFWPANAFNFSEIACSSSAVMSRLAECWRTSSSLRSASAVRCFEKYSAPASKTTSKANKTMLPISKNDCQDSGPFGVINHLPEVTPLAWAFLYLLLAERPPTFDRKHLSLSGSEMLSRKKRSRKPSRVLKYLKQSATEGRNLAANGGLTLGSGIGTVMRTATTGDSVCIVTSAATQLSGGISYVIY